jgi:hypoxanthine-guanine phosphoribosyltransferase
MWMVSSKASNEDVIIITQKEINAIMREKIDTIQDSSYRNIIKFLILCLMSSWIIFVAILINIL